MKPQEAARREVRPQRKRQLGEVERGMGRLAGLASRRLNTAAAAVARQGGLEARQATELPGLGNAAMAI